MAMAENQFVEFVRREQRFKFLNNEGTETVISEEKHQNQNLYA